MKKLLMIIIGATLASQAFAPPHGGTPPDMRDRLEFIKRSATFLTPLGREWNEGEIKEFHDTKKIPPSIRGLLADDKITEFSAGLTHLGDLLAVE